MTQPTHVPTNGFVAPPAGAPVVPPTADHGGFQVPPAGDPPRMPNANPIVPPGQQPGWVPQNPQTLQQPTQQQAPQQQAQPAQMDPASIAALIQQALGQQAPAQQPNAAPADAPAWAQGSLNEFDVASLDDPILKSMATVLQTVGKDLDLNRVLGNALAHGDPQLVDVAYLVEKGGANAQQLAEIAKGIVQAVEAKSNAIMAEVHTLAGGEAGWNASVAAFNSAAPAELKLAVSQMLDSTQQNMITAGAKIVAQFGKQSGLIPQQGAAFLQGAASSAAGGQGLSKAQFQAELQKLDIDKPGYDEARQQLFARRSLGKAAGL